MLKPSKADIESAREFRAQWEQIERRRAERHDRIKSDMEKCVADQAELAELARTHPLPWTWGMAYHDGWFIQFFDANGNPCLGDDLREPEYAALLLHLVNKAAP